MKVANKRNHNVNYITAVLNLAIVASAIFLKTWDYSHTRYLLYWEREYMSTVDMLLNYTYYSQGILTLVLIIPYIILIVCSILTFKKSNKTSVRVSQGIASLILCLIYIILHLGLIFEVFADNGYVSLTGAGFMVVGLCIVNVILSFFVMKSENKNLQSEEELCSVNNVEKS